MAVRSEEISSVLLRELEGFEKEIEMTDVGYVLEVGDGVARAYGLQGVMANEMVLFPNASRLQGRDFFGIALSLEMDSVGIVLMGEDQLVKEGDEVRTTSRIVEVPVGKAMLGRVVNALGQPIDGKGPIVTEEFRHIDIKAPGVPQRRPVHQALMTGIKAIDSMIPIGRGQRELIIGDRQTGKTAIGVDTMINQRYTHQTSEPVYCIYVAIGQKQSTVKSVVEMLERYAAMEYTIVVSAPASEPAPLQYIAPYAGCAMGEWFRDNGMHALIIYDDLSKHAQAYRQVSLLLRRPPGREAFPGDIFNLHSRLLERASKLNYSYIIVRKDAAPGCSEGVDGKVYSDPRGEERAIKALEQREDKQFLALEVRRNPKSGGSLTALPIIETQLGDYAAYIPTNVISITDGQIYLKPDLFNAGIRPAIDVGLSVSRVGGAARDKAMNKVAKQLKLDMARYFELSAFAQFASELDEVTRRELERGQRLVEVLKQDQYKPMSLSEQVLSIFVGINGYLDDLPTDMVRKFESDWLKFVHERYPEVVREIETTKDLSDECEERVHKAVKEFKARFSEGLREEAELADAAG